jgi:hypothetical protein
MKPLVFLRRASLLALGAVLACIGSLALVTMNAQARDDGRYANSPLKAWFDSLHSKSGGACCSNADGLALSDVDWDTKDGHYRVRLDGAWIDVPADAVITEPNRAGLTMVWSYYVQGRPTIRCFLPGTMT